MATPQQVVYGQGVVIAELVSERDTALLRAAQAEARITELETKLDDQTPPARAPRRAPKKETTK